MSATIGPGRRFPILHNLYQISHLPKLGTDATGHRRGNNQVVIGKENCFLSADGNLMPTRKDQPPPDLKYT
jgi:hypothetical protein